MRPSIAVVDDDPAIRRRVAHAVMSAPDMLFAGAADDIASGRALIDRSNPDVLLVDLGLPSGSGIELIRHATLRQHPCDIMVLTTCADAHEVLASIEAGPSGYVIKYDATMDLPDLIRTLRTGGSPVSPIIARQLLNRVPRVGTAGSASPSVPQAEEAAALSAQECKVLTLSSQGHTYTEIAKAMDVSLNSVMTYVKRAYRKLRAHSKTEAVYRARQMGCLTE